MAPQSTRRGLLIILSSPSGAGKSTHSKRLRAWDPTIEFSVSATTRAPRAGEVDGADYHFRTVDDFKQMVAEGDMLEHAHVFGNFYGSPRGPVQEAIDRGVDVLFDVDWQGAEQIKDSPLGQYVLSVFFLPPSIAELRRRLEGRGQDDAATIDKRMEQSWDEISHWRSYDYVLINDDVDATEAQLRTIVEAERQKRDQQPALADHVRVLHDEFIAIKEEGA